MPHAGAAEEAGDEPSPGTCCVRFRDGSVHTVLVVDRLDHLDGVEPGALAIGLRLLGVPRGVRGAGILLRTFPVHLAVDSGQGTFFWSCVLAVAFQSLQPGPNVLREQLEFASTSVSLGFPDVQRP